MSQWGICEEYLTLGRWYICVGYEHPFCYVECRPLDFMLIDSEGRFHFINQGEVIDEIEGVGW